MIISKSISFLIRLKRSNLTKRAGASGLSMADLLKDYQSYRKEKNLPNLIDRQVFEVDPLCQVSSPAKLLEPKFRVMQWNMLAQALSQGGENFILCPSEALEWDNRKLHIIQEILTYNPTILCLQEVDQFEFLETELSKVGYEGTFYPKPSSPCLYFKRNYGPDGCAMFWKKSDVSVVSIEKMVIEDDNGSLTNQICILAHLKLKQSDQELYILETHLKAKEGYHHLRHEQSQFIKKLLQEKCTGKPIILCGDFNADPSEKAYSELMSSDLDLSSCYTFLNDARQEPPFTTIKTRGSPLGPTSVCRTIDFIMFSRNNLAVTSLVKLPTKEEIGDKMLPSFIYPSDHLSLISDFCLTKS